MPIHPSRRFALLAAGQNAGPYTLERRKPHLEQFRNRPIPSNAVLLEYSSTLSSPEVSDQAEARCVGAYRGRER